LATRLTIKLPRWTSSGSDGINAIDSIGGGPWVNAKGVTVATSTDNLLSDNNKLKDATVVTESSEMNGIDVTPNRHDTLTGTSLKSLASTDSRDTSVVTEQVTASVLHW